MSETEVVIHQENPLARRMQGLKRIKNVQQQLAEIGRIRMGFKGDRNIPQKLKVFRLTSTDRDVLEAAANLYGGDVAEWNPTDTRREFELFTRVDSLPIMISPIPISQYMEDWGGAECRRRCDSETEMISGKPCICESTGKIICKPTTRFSCIMEELPGWGVWRLESHGWTVATEFTQTADLLLQWAFNQNRPIRARLTMKEQRRKKDGKWNTFMVPMLMTYESPMQLITQAAQNTQIEQQALEARPGAQVLPANPRGRYWALHQELGYPTHDDGDRKLINYRVWTALLGRLIGSGGEIKEEEWAKLSNVLQDVLDDKHLEPEEWEAFRMGDHSTQLNFGGDNRGR